MGFLFYTSIVLFILVCLILIGIVLLQKGRGGGLSGAFGGGGGNTAFGAKTGDVLTWATSIIFGIFVLLAVALNLLANYRENQSNIAANAAAQLEQKAAAQQAAQKIIDDAVEKSTTRPSQAAPATQPAK